MTWPAGTNYVKTSWNTGDTITAILLNHLETQFDKVSNGGVQLTNPLLIGAAEQEVPIAIASNVLTVDLGAGNWFTFTLSSHVTTTTLNNEPGNHLATTFVIAVIGDVSQSAWDWFTSTVKWDNDIVPPLPANGKIAEYAFTFRDGGTVIRGKVLATGYSA